MQKMTRFVMSRLQRELTQSVDVITRDLLEDNSLNPFVLNSVSLFRLCMLFCSLTKKSMVFFPRFFLTSQYKGLAPPMRFADYGGTAFLLVYEYDFSFFIA